MSKKDIPFIAVGSDELGEDLKDTITCPHCGKEHEIKNGEEKDSNGIMRESTLLQYYKCGKKTYLAGINGRSINK